MASVEDLKAEGNNHFKTGEYAAAVDLYTRAADAAAAGHPELPKILGNRAFCYLKMGESNADARADVLPKCVADCDAALKIDPNFDKVIFRRLRAHQLLGNRQLAAEDAREFLTRQPGHDEASRLGLELGMYSVDGKMPERDGMAFDLIIMTARWVFNGRHQDEVARVEGFPRDGDLNDFMLLPRNVMGNVNLAMMSYWHQDATGVPGSGVYARVKEIVQASAIPGVEDPEWRQQADRECLSWPETRIKDNFLVHKLLPEGTILVTADVMDGVKPRVYMALGLGDAIHCLAYKGAVKRQANNVAMIRSCLLPWRGRLVYDGIIMGRDLPPALAKKAVAAMDEAYTDAVAHNTVISSIPDDVLIEAAARASATRDVDEGMEEEDEELSPEEQSLRDKIAAAPIKPEISVVCRRLGYSPVENPNKLIGILVMEDDLPIHPMPRLSQMGGYTPTVSEILTILAEMAAKGTRPSLCSVDHLAILDRLKFVLDDVVPIGYYPPPSADETDMYMASAPS